MWKLSFFRNRMFAYLFVYFVFVNRNAKFKMLKLSHNFFVFNKFIFIVYRFFCE